MSERIGLFGGSFNPPHVAHVLAVHYALSVWPLDRILVVPNFQHPFGKELANFDHRFEMTRLAFRHLGPNVEISAVERDLGEVSYTIDTVRELKRRYADTQFRLIVGSDILDEVDRWKDADQLAQLAPRIVLPRLIAGQEPIGYFLPAISSTEIREGLTTGKDLTAMVPRDVLAYIDKHKLYRG
ncbi:MAG: nicotinate (nicotinamide) nucleotide adenylyltransferase [Candidatus Sumerlaeaceae bacterium]|nr:nicotinate (nicotinamide) nucleotide adenylyltransferase [Candidatus Sumerlaeaceae bacterium]